MDEIQYQYLRYNRYLMSSLGQWPLQSNTERILISMVFVPIIAAQLILQGGGLVCAIVDMDAFMEGVAPFLISLMCLAKYINYVYNFVQMRDLFIMMQNDWKIYKRYEHERKILFQYYDIGKRVTFIYAASVYGSMIPFMLVPTLINIANAFGILNTTDDKPLLFRVDYFVDVDNYYYSLLIHSYFGTIGYITIVVAMDTMNSLYVQHGCALCEILGYQLEKIGEDDGLEIDLCPDLFEDKPRRAMKECIKLHNYIMELVFTTNMTIQKTIGTVLIFYSSYAIKLERTHTTSHFFQLTLNMISISFTGFQASTKLDTPDIAFSYAFFTVAVILVVFLESWPGQQLTDHTDRLTEYATRAKWYQTSLSTRKDLNIMIMRTLKPIQLTAGKLYVLNLESFSKVVRTSFSYFTVLCSMQ